MARRPGTGWKPPETQRDKVTAAALQVFDEVGYSKAKVEDIQLISGVSVGSIYHHFGSKEGIAGDIYLGALRSFRLGLVQALREADGAEAGARGAVRHYLAWVDADRPRARFLLRRRETEVAHANAMEVERLNRSTFEEIELWYRPHVESGALRDLPPLLLHAVWFGPAQEYARVVLEGGRRGELRAAEDALADAAWAALRSSR